MIWEEAIFYAAKEMGKDELSNSITELVEIGKGNGRIASWTQENVDVIGRDMIKQNVKLITNAKLTILNKATYLLLNGQEYKITSLLVSTKRWSILAVEKYRKEWQI